MQKIAEVSQDTQLILHNKRPAPAFCTRDGNIVSSIVEPLITGVNK